MSNPFPDQSPMKRGNPNWVKGASGNPKGRPKIPREVLESARALSMEALETLADVMRDTKATASARVTAAQTILDRAWGKPTQPIDANVNVLDRLSEHDAVLALGVLETLASGEGDAAAGTETAH